MLALGLFCQAASPLSLARRAVKAGDANGDGMLDAAECEKQVVAECEERHRGDRQQQLRFRRWRDSPSPLAQPERRFKACVL